MLSKLINFLKACWRPSDRYAYTGSDAAGRQDGLLWYKDIGHHLNGDFSMAVVQANMLLEDQSQIESGSLSFLDSGPYGTFVGVYDGHGGPETSRYVNDNLFQNLKRFTTEQQSMSVDVIQKAFQATEEGFLSIVTKQWMVRPQLAAVGSCCLVGVVCGGTLYIANAGDSRAVLGRTVKATGEVIAIQLSTEHNASIESVRQELHSLHPDDPHIVVLKHNVWRVKGLIQISRSIGDVYLKKAEFNREPLYAKFRLRDPIRRPILSADPSISVHEIQPEDRFLIFASDGLWEHLSNQEAVDIVQNHPHNGSARRLVKAALQEAAKKREMRYSDLKRIERGVRRHFHDDITVVVVFLDLNLVSKASSSCKGPTLSLRGGGVHLPAKTLAPLSTTTEVSNTAAA
ncbi:probable protein phosphatase 2C 46 [Cynara cardunculus var. scolymus]|uniref:probable protein phosphatase 2C 46 n=1 Tax=Cynara cardunculus var. scolymus TaxID=59895 RepID=UPI000D624A29|nr:probable protein phosphatase 2C 46 [Cynara cardunculus var. scolymus]XP_024974310.1 probable protein phosphatase 2C 46 [Cynara cardunculus var. scolymus]